jgi:hypothetical protein
MGLTPYSGDTKAMVRPEDKSIRYRIAAVSKHGVSPFSPLIPNNPIFYHGQEFRDFFLSKVNFL